ncbi:Holliday junction branch migration protein RuvA [Sphingomonas sp.]|uniref:Holliday junction branch migration protein RuvA n=1 Tax=Sphingomonas sp. TaxID=28214 RepID=UPI003AFFB7E7
MIARLSGRLAELGVDHVVVDVHGVGLLVLLSARTLAAIGGIGSDVLLLTEFHVREDALTLYGFGSGAERDWFRLLTGVQGVGGRVALAILSVLAPDELSRAVAAGDKAMVARANGVGAKLATRIVTELKDRAGPALGPAASGSGQPVGGVEADALSALANLGFRPAEATAAVGAAIAELGGEAGLDAVVRIALRKASRA